MLEVNKIYNMDCLEGIKLLDDNSIDSIVTDPPYELGFMGKKWDSTGIAYNVELWKECLRVLKPGGHLLAFGGTRTYHRMTCAIEDAGFEIRDCIQWLYGSGFPKSYNIAKGIEGKLLHGNANTTNYKNLAKKNEREQGMGFNDIHLEQGDRPTSYELGGVFDLDATTPEAEKWEGWGTCLKPANEPIVLARKPISEKSIAENVMKWGTGGLNIDGCRIKHNEKMKTTQRSGRQNAIVMTNSSCGFDNTKDNIASANPKGRFPANIILDEEAGRMLDKQQKGASRFFYCAKASKKERNMGLEDMPEVISNDGRDETLASGNMPHNRGNVPKKNHHPTVKPIKLMEYLITLITPPNGIVLDPFMGSGTTAIACKQLGFDYIGFEKEKSYSKIIEGRVGEPPVTIEDKPSKKLKEDWLDDILAL